MSGFPHIEIACCAEICTVNAMEGESDPQASRYWLMVVSAAIAAASLPAFVLMDRIMVGNALDATSVQAQGEAEILATGLQAELDKFSLVPLVLSDGPQVRALLEGAEDVRPELNRRFELLARQTNAAAIYLMDTEGETLVASNWNQPESFVGSNYSFRGYFQQALANGTSTQFALGSVSQRPGLYMAQRVGPPAQPLGIVAVKVEFDALEESWRDATQGVYVTNANGVVLVTSEEDWRFRTTMPERADLRDPVADQRRFGVSPLVPLDISGAGNSATVEVPLLDAQQPIAPVGWTFHLLTDPSLAIDAARANGRLIMFLLLAALAVMVGFVWVQRKRRESRAEALVAERTSTLRDQLLQANRLATLGQVSAGIGHEIRQPLAAIRVFAENGGKMIAGGDGDGAGANLSRIVELTDRISSITGELRRFSRRNPSERRAMPVGEVIDGALLLLRDRMARHDITCDLPSSEEAEISVVAEHVRLEQVLVNLLQNAIDAAGEAGHIAIAIRAEREVVHLSVRDDGPGITSEQADQLFQPFATTKEHGLGLGLVISLDIMRDLGGELAFTPTDVGACFTMTIPRAR